MKKITLLLTAFLFCLFNVFGQTGEVKKISLKQAGGVINLFKNGLIFKTTDGLENEFTFYDEDLKKNGNVKLMLNSKKEYISSYYYDTILNKIMVFHNLKKVSSLTTITPDTKKKKTITLTPPAKQTVGSSIITLDKSNYILTFKKSKTFLNTIDIAKGKITPVDLPEEWKARTILSAQRVNSSYMAVLYLDKKVQNKKYKNIAIIDDKGNIVEDQLLSNDKDDFPIEEFSITDLGNDEIAIAGTYSKNVNTPYSIGMFVAKVEKLKLTYIKYYDYNKIKNFYNFMSEKKKEKAEKKA